MTVSISQGMSCAAVHDGRRNECNEVSAIQPCSPATRVLVLAMFCLGLFCLKIPWPIAPAIHEESSTTGTLLYKDQWEFDG